MKKYIYFYPVTVFNRRRLYLAAFFFFFFFFWPPSSAAGASAVAFSCSFFSSSFLLLVHGTSNEQVHNSLCQNVAVVIKLKFSKDVIDFLVVEFVPEGGEDVFEVLIVQGVASPSVP